MHGGKRGRDAKERTRELTDSRYGLPSTTSLAPRKSGAVITALLGLKSGCAKKLYESTNLQLRGTLNESVMSLTGCHELPVERYAVDSGCAYHTYLWLLETSIVALPEYA